MVVINVDAIIAEAWAAGYLEYKLDDLQRSISATVREKIASGAKKICIMSSRQIGKSYWGTTFAVEYLLEHPGKIARVIAPTLKSCYDIVNDNLSVVIQDAPKGLITSRRSSLRWNVGESSLRLGALERRYVDTNRGGNASLVIYEECGFVESDDFHYGVNSVIGPQLLRSNGIEIFISSPPENPEHELVTVIEPECDSLGTSFAYSVFDSPSVSLENAIMAAKRAGCKLSDAFIAEITKEHGVEGFLSLAEKHGCYISDDFKREYLALVIRPLAEMLVPHYIDTYPYVEDFDPPYASNWHVTIDWGGVKDFTVAILHTYEVYTGWHLIFDEIMFPPNTSTDDIHKGLKDWENKYVFYLSNGLHRAADVSGQTQIDLLALGYDITLPAKQDWSSAVKAVGLVFSQERIKIMKRCEFLRKTLKGGRYNKQKTDFGRTKELGHCDAFAALMYGIREVSRESPFITVKNNNAFDAPKLYARHKETEERNNIADKIGGKRFGAFK